MDVTSRGAYNTGEPKAESGLDHIENRLQDVSQRMSIAIDKLRAKSSQVSLQLPQGSDKPNTVGRSLAPAFVRLRDAIATLDGYAEQIESITLGLDI